MTLTRFRLTPGAGSITCGFPKNDAPSAQRPKRVAPVALECASARVVGCHRELSVSRSLVTSSLHSQERASNGLKIVQTPPSDLDEGNKTLRLPVSESTATHWQVISQQFGFAYDGANSLSAKFLFFGGFAQVSGLFGSSFHSCRHFTKAASRYLMRIKADLRAQPFSQPRFQRTTPLFLGSISTL
jgi:hypothetical protein